ncbi:ABC transporter substrate-binding protein [Alicyclobacillus sp. TC]|uniref:ABC transporter substrate-binding protein n=1 Tax=Alicyclobacillus sp. TC TaxID=2606450 RepID=UPI001932ECF0|nr:ABC transporter substrate-binding protein [Alicyclobacillus sp. TC]QRF22694.1 ABC transporter substrate-binding protein [Alicyclobacillus sp. TC]
MKQVKKAAMYSLVGLTFLGLVGCGTANNSNSSQGGSTSSGKPVTIVVASWSGTNVTNGIIDQQLADFNKTHPGIHAVYRPISGNYETILKTEFVAGDAPDIITLNNGGQAPTFESEGAVIPLNSYIKQSNYSLSDFFSGALNMFVANGQVYGIPRDQSPLVLYYNPVMFKQAGISGPPKTWAELYADAKKLTNPAKKIYGIVQTPQEPRWAQFVYQAGGSVMNHNMTQMTLNTPAALKGFSFFVNLYRSGVAAQPQDVGATWGGQALGMGRAAMTFEGAWAIPYLQDTYPNTSFAIATLPKGPVNNVSLDFPTAWAITKDCSHPQQAWEVIQYLTGAGQAQWVEQGGLVTVRKSLIDMPYYKEHPIYENILKQLPNAVPWNFPNGFDQYVNTTLSNETLLAVDGKESTAQALQKLQSEGESILQNGGSQ